MTQGKVKTGEPSTDQQDLPQRSIPSQTDTNDSKIENTALTEPGGNNPLIMIIGAAGILLIVLIVFAYRRIKLFKRASGSLTGEEEDKHE